MSLISQVQLLAAKLPAVEFDVDDQGVVTADPILPPIKEVVIGSLASLIIFALLWKFAWPPISKAMKDRTARIQGELDGSASAKAAAEQEAAEIRSALGDIDAERQRLMAEAQAQADALLADGRARLEQEIADLEARADADIAMAATRGADDLQADIARFAGQSLEQVVTGSLDDAAQHDLIENFIARVGAGGAA